MDAYRGLARLDAANRCAAPGPHESPPRQQGRVMTDTWTEPCLWDDDADVDELFLGEEPERPVEDVPTHGLL